MLKEVNKAQLQEECQNLVEMGAHLGQIAELLEERAARIKADVETIATAIPAEGVDTAHIPVALLNQMIEGLKELVRLVGEESMTQHNRTMFARKIWNEMLEAGLSSFLPPDPPRDPEEAALERLRNEERMKKIMSDKGFPLRF